MSSGTQPRPRWRYIVGCAVAVAGFAASLTAPVMPVEADTPPVPIPAGNIAAATDGHAESYAWGAATLPDGSVIISDYWNARVLHYAKDGTELGPLFSTAVEPGIVGTNDIPYGLAVGPDGIIYVGTYYVSPRLPSVVQRWAPDGTGGYEQLSPITHSAFRYPSRVAIAADGDIYVSDMFADRIFVFSPAGQFKFSWGGTGTDAGEFRQPRGIAFDASSPQRLYVADANNVRVQVFNESGDFLFSFKDRLKGNLRGLAVDPRRGAVYVVSIAGQTVSKFDLAGNWQMNIGSAGGLQQTTCCATPDGRFTNGGRELTVDGDGKIWVADMPNFRVQVFSPQGVHLFSRPEGGGAPANGGLNGPRGVGVDGSGNIVVADTRNQRIQRFRASGAWAWSIGLRGSATGYFMNYPGGIGLDRRDGSVIVSDTSNHRIKKFTSAGDLLWQVGGFGAAMGQFRQPVDAAVGPTGRVYVTDTGNARVQVLDGATGAPIASFGAGNLTTPNGITLDPTAGEVYVADSGEKAIQVFSTEGVFRRSIRTQGTAWRDSMGRPYGVAVVDAYVFATDRGKHKVFMFRRADGAFIRSFAAKGSGPGQLRDPQGMDASGGRLFIADTENDRISIWCVSSVCGA